MSFHLIQKNSKLNIAHFIRNLGPGLLYAGAAIGVSHLVQSTRAGAYFGLDLIVVVWLVHIVKFPFIEAGPKYAGQTGNTLISGYRSVGKWAVITFLIYALCTVFFVQAAVTVVTAGIAQSLFPLSIPLWCFSLIVAVICSIILLLNAERLFNQLVKYIVISLSALTLLCLGIGMAKSGLPVPVFGEFQLDNHQHLLFLIAFIGWMPAPLDISVWHSAWQSGCKTYIPKDFTIGYWGTAVLASCFIFLGTITLYHSGTELPESAVGFATTFIDMYTQQIGKWSYPIVGAAALFTMFSTTLTCLDAQPRVIEHSLASLKQETFSIQRWKIGVLIATVIPIIIIAFWVQNLKAFIDFVTTVSFVGAPVIAFLNFKAMQSLPTKMSRPKLVWNYISLALLTIFALWYLVA